GIRDRNVTGVQTCALPISRNFLATGHIQKIPRDTSNDFNPMWIGDKVYFLSDRNGPVTLFCYDTHSERVKQIVENEGLDLKSARSEERRVGKDGRSWRRLT